MFITLFVHNSIIPKLIPIDTYYDAQDMNTYFIYRKGFLFIKVPRIENSLGTAVVLTYTIYTYSYFLIIAAIVLGDR